MPRSRAFIESIGTISSAGSTLDELREHLFAGSRHFLTVRDDLCGFAVPTGTVSDSLLTSSTAARTHRLIDACLAQMPQLPRRIAEVGASRTAVVLGASTSGMPEVEAAMRTHAVTGHFPCGFSIRGLNLYEPVRFVADRLGITGIAYTISNACASGAMAVISAVRLLETGLADLVLTGGVDSLSRFTTSGFAALEAVSRAPCRPFCANRNGINLGEGGTLMLLSREKSSESLAAVTGFGETSDAHHISAPDPTGAGAELAMREALSSGNLTPEAIDLISAHGTGTVQNDQMEARAIKAIFDAGTPVASYKRLTGHTLAGAGALQAAIALAHLTGNPKGMLAANASDTEADPALGIRVLDAPMKLNRPVRHVLTNAFAFGGSNASVLYSFLEAVDS